MNQSSSMNGRYYRTCINDIRSSEGWFGKLCLLGLISFIPVFGQMTVSGYAYEWAHKAAWGIQDPMPKKIYGRPGSKMLRWGWFVIVITFVFALIPLIISMIGSFMNGAGSPDVVYTGRGVRSIGPSNPALIAAGGVFSLIGTILAIIAGIFAWVGCIRMTIYDRLGTGLQFGKIWKMAKHDFGGLMRIFGMSLIWGLIFGFIAGFILTIIVAITIVPVIATGAYASSSSGEVAGLAIAAILFASPIFLIFAYVLCVAQAFLSILIARAVGYWARQFDVGSWGTKDDPLPFETQPVQQTTQYAMPQQPYQQQSAQGQQYSQQPAQPQDGPYAQTQPAQPVEQPTAGQPEVQQAQPMAEQPVEQPAVGQAVEQATSTQPVETPAAGQPEAQPMAEQPVEQPATAQPAVQTQPQQAESPVEQAATSPQEPQATKPQEGENQ